MVNESKIDEKKKHFNETVFIFVLGVFNRLHLRLFSFLFFSHSIMISVWVDFFCSFLLAERTKKLRRKISFFCFDRYCCQPHQKWWNTCANDSYSFHLNFDLLKNGEISNIDFTSVDQWKKQNEMNENSRFGEAKNAQMAFDKNDKYFFFRFFCFVVSLMDDSINNEYFSTWQTFELEKWKQNFRWHGVSLNRRFFSIRFWIYWSFFFLLFPFWSKKLRQ